MSEVILKSLTKTFGKTVAVDNIDLEIKEGSFVTLVGPSGCGKTTTLRMIAGFISPDSGDIFIGGKSQKNIPPNKRSTSIVFQDYAIFPHMTVAENVSYGLKNQDYDKKTIKTKTQNILEMLGMVKLGDRYANQLSGGQQQRVALARSMVLKPKVLMMDEPLSNLDAQLRDSVAREFKNLQRDIGITTVYVTHDQSEALSMSDQVAVMNKGSFEQVGHPKEIYSFPKTKFVADFIGEANYISGEVKTLKENKFDVEISKNNIVSIDKKEVNFIGDEEGELEEKQKITLVLRPEAIEINCENEDLTGEITDRMFYGGEIWYWVKIAENIIVIKQNTNPKKKILSGEVKLNINKEWINIIF